VSQNALLEKLWLYGNLFSTSALNSLYCQLPNRTGKQKKGIIYPAFHTGDDEEQLVQSTNKTIMDDKNWSTRYQAWGEREINGITGHYSCGSTYALTLMPATLSHSLAIQGETWETTVTSTGAWKIDESTLPAWLSVSPQQGNSGTKVTVTAQANTEVEQRSAALTFVLTDDPTTKQVVILKQNSKPPLLVTPAEECTFPAAGKTKANYITVESTQEWTVTSSAAWCTVEPKEGETGTKQATVKAEANTGKEAREAALTFALKANAEIKQVVKVKQEGTGKNSNAVEDVLLAGVSVAPNPFTSQLVIKNSEGIKGRYELVSANGVTVRSGSLQGSETVLRTEELKAGVYLLRILSGEGVKTFNVVKE